MSFIGKSFCKHGTIWNCGYMDSLYTKFQLNRSEGTNRKVKLNNIAISDFPWFQGMYPEIRVLKFAKCWDIKPKTILKIQECKSNYPDFRGYIPWNQGKSVMAILQKVNNNSRFGILPLNLSSRWTSSTVNFTKHPLAHFSVNTIGVVKSFKKINCS